METTFAAADPLWHLVILAFVQGITEFLPISSSAHLILVPVFTGWQDQGLAIDVAMHIGTLAAVILYFRKDVMQILRGAGDVVGRRSSADARLALQLVIATLPVVVLGFLFKEQISLDWRSPLLIAVTTAVFGLLLWKADRGADRLTGTILDLTWKMALIIGLMQAVALLPGVSRSGITMTAALLLGLCRTESARFSLLLSIPTTAAAGALGMIDLVRSNDAALQGQAVVAAVLAFGSALLAISVLMRWLKTASFMPFVIYRLVLAALLAALLGAGWI